MIFGDEQLEEDRYHCGDCDVTFREPYPAFYDVTPCPYCGESAENVVLAAQRTLGAPSYW